MVDDIEDLCDKLNYAMGGTDVIRSGKSMPDQEYIPTGIYSMDKAFKGIPRGKYISIEGHPGTYKTTLAMRMASQFDSVLYIDTEHRLNTEWMSKHCDMDKIAIAMPRNMEEAYNLALTAAEERYFSMIVIDSISMMAPLDELQKSSEEESIMALRARYTNRFMRSLTTHMGFDDSPTVIGVNHLNATMNSWGKKYDIPCGRQQGYTTALRLQLRGQQRLSHDDDNDDIIGELIQWCIIKRSMYSSANIGVFCAFNAPGVYNGREVTPGDIDEFDMISQELVSQGTIKKAGSWYEIDGEKYQGSKNAREPIMELVDKRYRSSLGG